MDSDPFEFLVFSDFHAHNFPYGASRVAVPGVAGLYNSRLADSVAVLDELLEYALEKDISYVFFCGDLFHRRTSVSTDVRHLVVERLHKFTDESIELHMIPGNHDMGDRKGNIHSLVGLGEMNDYIHVYPRIGVASCPAQGVSFVFVPYSDNIEDAREDLEAAGTFADKACGSVILFAHLGMQGAKVGSNYVLVNDSDISVPDVPRDKFTACFFGHFHEHQQLFSNGWVVGATHQHNWGDEGGARGFLHCSLSEGNLSFTRIETKAPKFITVHEEEELPVIKQNDFIRYLSSDKTLDKAVVQKRLGATNIEIIYSVEDVSEEFKLDPAKLTPSAMLDQWVDSKIPETLDKDKVLQVGRDILKEVDL